VRKEWKKIRFKWRKILLLFYSFFCCCCCRADMLCLRKESTKNDRDDWKGNFTPSSNIVHLLSTSFKNCHHRSRKRPKMRWNWIGNRKAEKKTSKKITFRIFATKWIVSIIKDFYCEMRFFLFISTLRLVKVNVARKRNDQESQHI
jgi:hypothetical protein